MTDDKHPGGTRRSVRRPPGRPQARHVTGTRKQPSSVVAHERAAHEGKDRAPMAQVVTMKQLLESGVHFGHQTRRWNPKMKRYIFTERNGIYIIDLQQSLDYIDRAYEFIKETVAHGGTILYVGTKKQAQEAIAEQARRVGMPFVNQRWLGGMLTNFSTVYKRLQRLKELEEIDFSDVASSGMTKKELLHLRREHDKLDRTLGGIRDMSRVPSAIWVVDTKKEHIAVNEARKLGIPVVAILDTNCDPDEVNYPIPGNDDAIRSVALLTRVVADAVAEGLISRAGAASGDEKPAGDQLGTEEPLAEWERELLQGSAPAAAAAPADAAAPAEEATLADTPAVAAAVAEATPEINAESAITTDEAAAADEADDLADIAETAATEAAAPEAAATEAAAPAPAATEAAAPAPAATEAAAPEASAPEASAAEEPAATEESTQDGQPAAGTDEVSE
jgi:small subunit ribosomal protein S2